MDGKTHKVIGTMVGGAAGLALCNEKQIQIGFPELAAALIGGFIGGCLADAIEPATHPWHRGAAHSLAFAALVTAFFKRLRDDGGCPDFLLENPTLRIFTVSLAAGHFSHLCLDLLTRNGLPMLSGGRGVSLHFLLQSRN